MQRGISAMARPGGNPGMDVSFGHLKQATEPIFNFKFFGFLLIRIKNHFKLPF